LSVRLKCGSAADKLAYARGLRAPAGTAFELIYATTHQGRGAPGCQAYRH